MNILYPYIYLSESCLPKSSILYMVYIIVSAHVYNAHHNDYIKLNQKQYIILSILKLTGLKIFEYYI